MNLEPWTEYSCASIEDDLGVIRLATVGERIRIRCTDLRFDPPIEMGVKDFAAIMKIAIAIGVTPNGGDVKVEKLLG